MGCGSSVPEEPVAHVDAGWARQAKQAARTRSQSRLESSVVSSAPDLTSSFGSNPLSEPKAPPELPTAPELRPAPPMGAVRTPLPRPRAPATAAVPAAALSIGSGSTDQTMISVAFDAVSLTSRAAIPAASVDACRLTARCGDAPLFRLQPTISSESPHTPHTPCSRNISSSTRVSARTLPAVKLAALDRTLESSQRSVRSQKTLHDEGSSRCDPSLPQWSASARPHITSAANSACSSSAVERPLRRSILHSAASDVSIDSQRERVRPKPYVTMKAVGGDHTRGDYFATAAQRQTLARSSAPPTPPLHAARPPGGGPVLLPADWNKTPSTAGVEAPLPAQPSQRVDPMLPDEPAAGQWCPCGIPPPPARPSRMSPLPPCTGPPAH